VGFGLDSLLFLQFSEDACSTEKKEGLGGLLLSVGYGDEKRHQQHCRQ
jgi:hypothetical protein